MRCPQVAAGIALLALWIAPGCGGEDVERGLEGARERAEEIREDVERQVADAREEFERRRDRFGRRIRDLGELERLFERPARTSPTVLVEGRSEPTTIEALTGCGLPVDDSVALYCPADDTIYIGQQFAADLAVGDFDVGNAQHHGTPTERRNALLAGYGSGDPSVCSRYVPA